MKSAEQKEDQPVVPDYITYTILVILGILVVYVAVRAGSIAYFRTKLEYLRHEMKEMRKGDKDGV